MKIRHPGTVQPTYANFTVIDWKRGEVTLNLCFAEGDEQSPTATVVHKVVFHTANFERMIQAGREALDLHAMRYGDT